MFNVNYVGQYDYLNNYTLPSLPTSSNETKENSAFEAASEDLSYQDRIKAYEMLELAEKAEKELKLESKKKDLIKRQKIIENNQKSDGSSSYCVPRKKSDSIWAKAGRWLSNAGTAVVNMGKSFVGIDKDGWHPEKMLKNVGIAALAVGATFIPVVGPVIGYGLLAAGAIGGGIGVAKGIERLDHARTDAEKDKVQQDICANAITAGLSVLGLRGLGKGLRTTSETSSLASSATEKTTRVGKVGENISNFFKDSTVNAYRATKQAVSTEKELLAQTGSLTKAYKAKLDGSWKNFNDRETIYTNKKQSLENSLDARLQEINSKLSVETNAAKKALLNEERQMIELNLNEVRSLGNSVKTKAEYESLLKDNSATFNKESLKMYGDNVNGVAIAPKRMAIFKKQMGSMQKTYVKQLKQLAKAKAKEMRAYAKHPDKYTAKLNEYVPNRTLVQKKWYKPSTYFKNEYQTAIGGNNIGYGETISKGYSLLKTPAAVATLSQDRWTQPVYGAPLLMGGDLTPEETTSMLEIIEQQIMTYDTFKEELESCKTEEELDAVVAKIKDLESGVPATAPQETETVEPETVEKTSET